MTPFDSALEFVLRWEGGYVNHPTDPGGETNMGISKRAYPNEDIKNMTRERAAFLYRRDYWDACNCDALLPGMALMAFDTAVNCGVKRAKAWLLTAKPKVNPLRSMAVSRAKHYALLDSLDDVFALGWYNRLFSCYDRAKELT